MSEALLETDWKITWNVWWGSCHQIVVAEKEGYVIIGKEGRGQNLVITWRNKIT